MFCKKCGNKVADGAAFCNKCGAPLKAEAGTTGNGASRAFGKKAAFLAVGAIVVVLAAAIGGGMLFGGKGDADPKHSASMTASESAGREETTGGKTAEGEIAEGETAEGGAGKAGEPDGLPRTTDEAAAGVYSQELRIEEHEKLQMALKMLAYSLAEYNEAYGSTQENVARLFAGDWTMAREFIYNYLYYTETWEESKSPLYIDQFRNVRMVYASSNSVSVGLDASQLEYVASSLTGSGWHLNSVNDIVPEGTETMFIAGEEDAWKSAVFNLELHDTPGFSMENFVTEYTGEGTWRVTADFWLPEGFYGPERWYGWRMTAEIADNPDSCFDGYSVTELDFARTDLEWKQAYCDLVRSLSGQWEGQSTSNRTIIPFYLDDDAIPELLILSDMGESIFATCHDGRCAWLETGLLIYDLQYIPGTGMFLMDLGGVSGCYGEEVYRLAGNEFQLLGKRSGEGSCEGLWDESWDENLFTITENVWNGQAVTKEEWDVKREESFPRASAEALEMFGGGGWDPDGFLAAVISGLRTVPTKGAFPQEDLNNNGFPPYTFTEENYAKYYATIDHVEVSGNLPDEVAQEVVESFVCSMDILTWDRPGHVLVVEGMWGDWYSVKDTAYDFDMWINRDLNVVIYKDDGVSPDVAYQVLCTVYHYYDAVNYTVYCLGEEDGVFLAWIYDTNEYCKLDPDSYELLGVVPAE